MADINIRAGSSARWREEAAKFVVWTVWFLMASAAISIVTDAAGMRLGWDSTDSDRSRSGLGLYVDHGKGCQYLGRIGALTPRMQADGKQAGCR